MLSNEKEEENRNPQNTGIVDRLRCDARKVWLTDMIRAKKGKTFFL